MAETDQLVSLRKALAGGGVAASTLWLLLRHDAATG
jgi:hypothetical protein